MKILYHCTRANLLNKIIKEGLVPAIPFQRKNKKKAIYLSKQPFKWMWNATSFGTTKGALLEIDITNLELKKDKHDDPRDKKIKSEGDYICLKRIEPKRIKKILVEDEKNCFKRG